ncbi:hypothetical protein GCM10010156_60360 [Planobispora rosea]|uniref:J domain-containing protein n=1 Tax=Planobispora rosea TaxID=35762 RepID=A0A8J3S782_PLARO|nr:DnaJ domain-containing protein [Planobispora rosea]GGS94020.1 hypothetical protein GCM10010156_60360 [Planobispora rosea]GIH87370.1 hypothetical protein Pro02_57780 [Planobispora rosea]
MGTDHLQGKDPYQVLGVPSTATPEDLRQAYRRLARRYHPDKNPQGEAVFAEIASAYGLLSDPERRLRHDLERQSAPPGQAVADGHRTTPAPETTTASTGRTAAAPPGGPYGDRPRGRRARPEPGDRPEDPLARLERLYGPRPTVGTAVKLVLFHLPAGGFLSVLASAFITVSMGDAARDLGRSAAVLVWLALWSVLVAAKVRLWLLYRRVSGSGGR